MDNKPDFCEILAHSERLEMVRLDRELNALMEDEFVLDRELEQKLCNGSYHFPDVSEIRTDKQVLTRTQAYFSAKIHVRRTPVYFHNHEFIEMLYICMRGAAGSLLRISVSVFSLRRAICFS